MVLVGDRRPEQREDAVTGGLHDVTVVAMDCIHHQRQRRIDDGARLLRVEVFHQFGRALYIGEQRRDRLALAVDCRRSVRLLWRDTNIRCGVCRWRSASGDRAISEWSAALAAEIGRGRVFRLTFRARFTERIPALRAEIVTGRITCPALCAMHRRAPKLADWPFCIT